MLSITSKSPYARPRLTELARIGGADPVPIGELARRRDIPVQFLEQLFAVLRRAGSCAPSAGSRAATPSPATPRTITVLEVVELLDGRSARGADAIFSEAAAAARAVLAKTTITAVVERENREAGATMYYIWALARPRRHLVPLAVGRGVGRGWRRSPRSRDGGEAAGGRTVTRPCSTCPSPSRRGCR